MNFDDAILVHIKWKVRLRQFIDGTGKEKLSSTSVDRDDACELGKWLLDEGMQYKDSAHYESLCSHHTEFHHIASAIIKMAEDGNKDGATKMISDEFSKSSKATVTAIMKVKKEAYNLA
jgi:methyl-accepting chemotaxis protein